MRPPSCQGVFHLLKCKSEPEFCCQQPFPGPLVPRVRAKPLHRTCNAPLQPLQPPQTLWSPFQLRVRTEGSRHRKTPTHPAAPLTPSSGPPGHCPLCTLCPWASRAWTLATPAGRAHPEVCPRRAWRLGRWTFAGRRNWLRSAWSSPRLANRRNTLVREGTPRTANTQQGSRRTNCENSEKGGAEPRELPGRAVRAGPGDRTLLAGSNLCKGVSQRGAQGSGPDSGRRAQPGYGGNPGCHVGTSVNPLGREGVCLRWF